MSTKKTTPPPKSIHEPDLVKVENLVRQLDAVQHIADSGYWLTTEELSLLLGLDSATTASFIYKKESYCFAWRNFNCTLMSRQDKLSFWSIRSQASQTLAFQNLSSLEVERARTQIPSSENLVILPSHLQNPSSHTQPRQNQAIQASQHNGSASLAQASNSQHHESEESESGIIPSVYAQIDNLLTWNQLRQLFKYVIDQEPNFVPTTNSANDPFYRRSMYLFSFPEFANLMIDRVRSIMPHIISHLEIQNFTVGDIEAQLTAHNDGNYYKLHNDNGSPDCANRELTYVYYFHREPKAFSGGELVIYDSVIKDGYLVGAKSFKTIQPRNNTIVFFPSRCMHEVLPVVCPSKAFADSRFTINGWVRHR
ncbi:2OG-Fe(II) oxygenase [Tumidithrix helvetica PCC 7403]|uniref:2OG-Fe(II) oxygenase n=1 Tax=Tumidithrix helvetica TaxID=3457545 RepID=UPI003CA6703B